MSNVRTTTRRSVPTMRELRWRTLEGLTALGGSATKAQLKAWLKGFYGAPTANEHWARSNLTSLGLTSTPRTGVYALTPLGRTVKTEKDLHALWKGSRSEIAKPRPASPIVTKKNPTPPTAPKPRERPDRTTNRKPTVAPNRSTVEPTADVPDVEGVGTADDDSPYPLRDMMVRIETRTASDVVGRIKKSRYIMDPGFQRHYVWNDRKASKLIESCIMRIPLPVLYVAENADGRITIVDGLQRLTTFKRFLDDELPLSLGDGHTLNRKRFSDLPIHLQERVEDTQLTLNILDKDAPDRARLDIFERVNGGVPLTRQQMRNAIYYGQGTKWLADMASHPAFLKATDKTLKQSTMRDREAINRFAAFHLLGIREYKGDMDGFLAQAILLMNKTSSQERRRMATLFRFSMQRNYELFGRHSFRKTLALRDADAQRNPINISLFDVLSDAFTRISDETVDGSRDRLVSDVAKLVQDEDFRHAIMYSTNSTKQVRTRFAMTEQVLRRFFE